MRRGPQSPYDVRPLIRIAKQLRDERTSMGERRDEGMDRRLSGHDVDQALGLVQLVLGVLAVQFGLSRTDPRVIAHDPWALGYTFGFFDSAVRSSGVSRSGAHRLALVAIAYEHLLGSTEAANNAIRSTTLLKNNSEFMAGKTAGTSELTEFLLRDGRPPEGLSTHLARLRSYKVPTTHG